MNITIECSQEELEQLKLILTEEEIDTLRLLSSLNDEHGDGVDFMMVPIPKLLHLITAIRKLALQIPSK